MESELCLHLLQCAEAYAAAKKMRLSTIGRLAAGDWRFFERLRDDETTFTVRKYDEAIRWFDANWPDEAEWPADVPRPVVETEPA